MLVEGNGILWRSAAGFLLRFAGLFDNAGTVARNNPRMFL